MDVPAKAMRKTLSKAEYIQKKIVNDVGQSCESDDLLIFLYALLVYISSNSKTPGAKAMSGQIHPLTTVTRSRSNWDEPQVERWPTESPVHMKLQILDP